MKIIIDKKDVDILSHILKARKDHYKNDAALWNAYDNMEIWLNDLLEGDTENLNQFDYLPTDDEVNEYIDGLED